MRYTAFREVSKIVLRKTPMIRAFSVLCFLPLILFPAAARACQCMLALSACNEVAASDLVFIGTVEAIEPMFLSRWNSTSPTSLRSLNDAYTSAREHPSAAAFAGLRDTFMRTFPELSADEKSRVQAAKTPSEISSMFYSTLYRGLRVKFRVKTLFKHEDDDDSPKDTATKDKDDDKGAKGASGKKDSVKIARAGKDADDDKDKGKKGDEDFFDVETAFGDCGYDFQEGETYLVYATSDEDSDTLSTSSCSRTSRLSDAGEDLSYLFFYKDHPEESARLDGFVTTDELYQTGLDRMHDLVSVKSPAPGVIVELRSDRMTRYAEANDRGRFVFDGLREGDYNLSAFAHGYPTETKLLGGPQAFHIAPKSCARQVLLLPKKEGN
jgi:hypothetical protein